MSLVLTRTQDMRANSNLDKWVYRASNYGALDHFVEDTKLKGGIITQDLIEQAERSMGSTLETAVIDYDAGVTISNTRSCTIADAENTSRFVTITFVTYSWGFTIVPSLYMNNEVKMQEDYEVKYKKHLYAFAALVDAACVAALSANKTQVYNDELVYANVGNVLTADLADEMRLFADIEPIMAANDFWGENAHFIGNTGFMSLVNRTGEHATYNDVNKQIQLNNRVIHYTNRIANDTDMGATFYAVMPGSTGLLYRFDRESYLRRKTNIGHNWEIDSLLMLDIPVGVHSYEAVGDYSAIAGAASADMTCVFKEFYGFSIDIAYMVAYNTDAALYPSPIIAAQIATT